MPVIVLVTKGKRESVEFATVRLFDSVTNANAFVEEVRTGPVKHWTHAEILRDDEEVELCMPEGEWLLC